MEPSTLVAPHAEPQTVSATHAAVIANDSTAFRKASRERRVAERQGKTVATVPVQAEAKAAPAAVVTPDTAPAQTPPLSSKERQQQKVNERIQAAIDEGIKTKLAEARTQWEKEHPTAAAAAPVVAAPPVEAPRAALSREPPKTFEEAIQRPDVSKPLITEEQFFKQFPDAPYPAYARYAAHYDQVNWQAQETQRADRDAVLQAQKAQIDGFVGQLQNAAKADPQFVMSLSDRVKTQVKPFTALQRDASGRQTEQGGPINVIGEQVYASDIAPIMLKHFSTHPEDLDRLITMPPSIAALPPALRTARHISWMQQEYGKLEAKLSSSSAPVSAAATLPAPIKTLTDAPAPARTLGRNTAEPTDLRASIIRSGDTGAYRKLRREQRAAAFGRR